MARWSDLATWVGPTPNQSGPMVEQRGVVVHIAEGSYDGTIAWQRNPDANVSSHFIVAKDGRIAQMVDTGVTAWTQRAGNGHWLSVENEGHTPGALTAAQVEANAKILAKAHQVYGVPLRIATNPTERGLGHHSMDREGIDPEWGHDDCPGPNIIAQKPAILARAVQIASGGEDDMDAAQFVQILKDPTVASLLRQITVSYPVEPDASLLAVVREMRANLKAVLADVAADDGNDITLTPDQVAQLADIVAAKLPTPAAVAKAVNDDAAARLTS